MMSLPSLKQLHYLVVLSEHLNFTRAAKICCVTQSTLSAGIKELETALNAVLVERNRQAVLMTSLGLEIAARARFILAATQDLVESAARRTTPLFGDLRLGVIPTIAPFLLPPALPLLRARYPALRLILREDLTASLLARLNDGELDFALIALPYATGPLHIEPLFNDALWLVGRKDDPCLTSPIDASTLADNPRLLLLEEGHCLREHALHACGETPASPAAITATSLLTLVQMIESGLGIGLIPEMAIRNGLTRGAALVVRPLAQPCPTRTIAVVARRSTRYVKELRALAEIFRSVSAGFHAENKKI